MFKRQSPLYLYFFKCHELVLMVWLCAWHKRFCPDDCNASLHCHCSFIQVGQGHLAMMSWLRKFTVSTSESVMQ